MGAYESVSAPFDDAQRLQLVAAAAFREAAAAAGDDAARAAAGRRRLVHIAHIAGDPADWRALAVDVALPAGVTRALGAVANFVAAIRAEEDTNRHSPAFYLRGELDPDALCVIAAALLAAAPRISLPCKTLNNMFVGV